MAAETTLRHVSRERQGWRRPPADVWLLWLVLGIGSLAMVAPFYWMIITAFKTRPEIMRVPPTWWPQEWTVTNFETIFQLEHFHWYFANSIFVATTITVAVLFTSALGGYVFGKFNFPGREVLFILCLSSLMVPFSVIMIPLYVLMVDLGWINTYTALIVPAVCNAVGIFLLRQYMHSIPNDLIDAARIDGASEWAIFLRIILPLCAAPLSAVGIFIFMWSWDEFLWPLLILNDRELYTLPLGLRTLLGRWDTDFGAVLAGATVTVLPVLVVYFFAQRRFIEGIALTGLKG